ncbi:adenylate kinase-domain-containing protein [Schizophyllum amplum]|uniref:GTP:AMP phosphotransferase, mitochondrial n=1 Tax=Schizophyllum amplum TaxID=97359 RepID=A0A550CD70_9AGAR|nr:adenylate kinase-domain-containing protein [Auriculariopsis ampla]
MLARPAFPIPKARLAGKPLGQRGYAASAIAQRALAFGLQPALRAQSDDEGGHRVLRMLMFGKPGAGKGTLAGRLTKKYDILSISSGDLLRQHIAERTEVGRQAEAIVAQGGLLPDEVMLKVVTSKLEALKGKHWILDGFPRTLGQGELLDAHLKKQDMPLSLVVNLDVPDEVILSRISDRWVHLPSGRVYNMSYNRPKIDGLDDETGEPLNKRPDDNPETFARRLQQFYASTSPLLDYYSAQAEAGNMATLHGTTSDEIWPQLEAVVAGSFSGLRERTPRVGRLYDMVSAVASFEEDRKRKARMTLSAQVN